MTDAITGRAAGFTAVMASRVEDKAGADYFPTPTWATRALFEHVLPIIGFGQRIGGQVWEPACGGGHMAVPMQEYCDQPVFSSDLYDHGFGKTGVNFLIYPPVKTVSDWIITNPPFKDAVAFTRVALDLAHVGVAMLCRLQWLESRGRYNELFSRRPPTVIAPFVERVPMVKGRWDPNASTATSYAWFVWANSARNTQTRLFWIPPGCRRSLTKPEDISRFGPAPDSDPAEHDPNLTSAVAALET